MDSRIRNLIVNGELVPYYYEVFTSKYNYFYADTVLLVKRDTQTGQVYIDTTYATANWDTTRYCSDYLNETVEQTVSNIDKGVYQLANLNKDGNISIDDYCCERYEAAR